LKRGDTVLFTLAVLLILFAFVAALLLIFKFWDKSSRKIMAGKEALRYARCGLDYAVWELEHDDRAYDCYLDAWRDSFAGTDVDSNDDGAGDARWNYFRGARGEIIGRYAVLVEDEAAKINLNACGNAAGLFHEGHSTAEIALLENRLGHGAAEGLARFRYGSDGLPGRICHDDDGDRASVESDGIDNDGDGFVDELGEGIDEPDEFRPARPFANDRPYFVPEDAKLARGLGVEAYARVKNLVTVFSFDLDRNRQEEDRTPVNTAPFDRLVFLLGKLGYEEKQANQIAVNVEDYRDRDSIPTVRETESGKFIGLERTAYLNETKAMLPFDTLKTPAGITFTERGGHFIELFNPYPTPVKIGGWKITGVVTFTGGSISIPAKAIIPPHGYYTIGDDITIKLFVPVSGTPVPTFLPAREPGGCDQYASILAVHPLCQGPFIPAILPFAVFFPVDGRMRLYDAEDNLVEEFRTRLDTMFTSAQKNDPRLPSGWFPGPATPNLQNAVFQPWVGGEFGEVGWLNLWKSSFLVKDGKMSTLGELSFIHRGEQWRTLDFWSGGQDRILLDEMTAEEKRERFTLGRLNINTAAETVLTCLPLVDRSVAAAIVRARPFRDISEVLGVQGGENPAPANLGREITRYGFDWTDNDTDGLADTEREKEMIFSKIISLITVRSDIYEIIATGQKVQDFNNNGTIDTNEIIAEKRLKIVYDRKRRKVLYRRNL